MDEEAVQVQGCGATPGDRDVKRSLLRLLTHRWLEIKGSNLTCFHRDAALVLDACRHDERSPPSTLIEATAALLSSRARTDGWRGRGQMEDKDPPLRDSANHTAGGHSLTLGDISTSTTNRFGAESVSSLLRHYTLYIIIIICEQISMTFSRKYW